MKKTMALIALLLAAAIVCCGCGAPKTPEEVVERMNDALLKTPCSQMAMEMDFDMGMDMGTLGSMEMEMAMDMEATICQDPIGMHMTMTLDMGMDGTNIQTTADNYVVLENDKLVSYTGTAGEWIKEESQETMESLRESMTAIDLTGANLTIDDTVTEWEGKKAICLNFLVTGDSVENALGSVMGSSDMMGEMSQVDWSAISCEGRIFVDAKTYLPLAEEMNIIGMDAAMAPAFEDMGLTVTIDEFIANVAFLSFEPQAPIELPAEAAEAVDMNSAAAA